MMISLKLGDETGKSKKWLGTSVLAGWQSAPLSPPATTSAKFYSSGCGGLYPVLASYRDANLSNRAGL